MRPYISFYTALVALLPNSVSGFALRSDLAKKLQLAAELGLDPDFRSKDDRSFRTAATQSEIQVEYVSVSHPTATGERGSNHCSFPSITRTHLWVLIRIDSGQTMSTTDQADPCFCTTLEKSMRRGAPLTSSRIFLSSQTFLKSSVR
ncbi:hypothetical protein BDV19DRAFT_310662 [Aspergillus venezuelensis]